MYAGWMPAFRRPFTMKPLPPADAVRRKSAVCHGGESSLLPIDGSVTRKGTIQAALKAAESLPDIPDADFDDLEQCSLHRR
jgi:hypothetical protein